MAKRITVVISQSQSKNPAKRNLEEEIVTGLLMEPGIDVTVVPHLYDLKPDGTGMLALQQVSGNLIVVSWIYERAAHWVLHRNDILGHVGPVLLKRDDEDDEDEEEFEDEVVDKDRVIDEREVPNRRVYCLDLRISEKAADYIEEIKRIQNEESLSLVSLSNGLGNGPANGSANGIGIGDYNGASNGSNSNGSETNGSAKQPTAEQIERFNNPTNSTSLSTNGNGLESNGNSNQSETVPASSLMPSLDLAPSEVTRIEETGGRRWYPVIDFSRCTNCMECIDFCLFGVYGVDDGETILVEQPDNCRKGCPACSRVCPENAIMFPQHKTPAIAGADEAANALKIDLSLLFGAPDSGKSAAELAALERDEQLVAAGRDAVGMSVGMPKRISEDATEERDDLDDLVDELDSLDI